LQPIFKWQVQNDSSALSIDQHTARIYIFINMALLRLA
jgi:hypothetical protein